MDIFTIGMRGRDTTAPCASLENAKRLIFDTWKPDNPSEVVWTEYNDGSLWEAEYTHTSFVSPGSIKAFIIKWDGFQGE